MGRDHDLLLYRHGSSSPLHLFCLLFPLGLTWSLLTIQAKNVVNYLRIIHRILAPGGVWINLGMLLHVLTFYSAFTYLPSGPLLWHFENNNTNDPSVELDLDEVKALARVVGFELSVSILSPLCTFYPDLSDTAIV